MQRQQNVNGARVAGRRHVNSARMACCRSCDKLCTCIYIASGGDVVILNDANFESTVLKNTGGDGWFVDFYAPWCGHCKTLAPVWESMATALIGTDTHLAKMDCTQNLVTTYKYVA